MMLNKAKKRAIVEWANCLLASDPIESLVHLADGRAFFKLSQLISQTDDDCETTREKYSFVEKCLSDFYKTSILLHVNLVACEDGDELELAILAILLLTAIVQVSLSSGQSLLQGLTQLEPRIQEDIQACISAILLGDDKNTSLPTNFTTILRQQTKYKEQATGSTPRKQGAAASYHTPKRDTRNRKRANDGQLVASPIPSPLKTLLDSPQVRQMVALRETQRELSKCRELLHIEQDRAADLENENKSKDKIISDKEHEIILLREKTIKVEQYEDAAVELAELKSNEEKKIEAVIKQHSKKYGDLVIEHEKLKEEKEKQNQEMCEMLKERTFAQSNISEKNVKIQELQEDVRQLREDLEAEKAQVKELCEERKNLQEILEVTLLKYEELKKDMERMEEGEPSDFQTGESLGMMNERRPEENRITMENLRADNGKKTILIANLRRRLEERANKIKDLEISRAALQQNLESTTIQSTGLVEENDGYRAMLSKSNEDLAKTKLELETLEKEFFIIKDENVILRSEVDSVNDKVKELIKEITTLKVEAVERVNSLDLLDKKLAQNTQDNEALCKDNENLKALKDSIESELEKVKIENLKSNSNLQILEKQLEEKNKAMISLETELSEVKKLIPQLDDSESKPSVVELLKANLTYTQLIREANEKCLQREMDYEEVCKEKDSLVQSQARLENEKQKMIETHSAELQHIRQEMDEVRNQMTSLIAVVKNEINSCLGEAGVLYQEHLGFDSNIQSYPEGEIAFLISHIHKIVSSYHKLKTDFDKLKDSKVESTNSTEGNIMELNLKLEEQKQELLRLNEQLNQCNDEYNVIKSQLDTEVSSCVEVMSQKERVSAELEQVKKELCSKDAELQVLKLELKEEINKFDKKEKEWNSQHRKLNNDIESITSDLQQAKKRNNDLSAKNKDLKGEVGKYISTNKKLHSEISEKTAQLKKSKSEKDKLESDNDKLQVDREKLKSKIERLSSEIEKLKNKNRRSSSKDLSSLEAECEKLREERSLYREKAEKAKKFEQELKQRSKEIQGLNAKIETMSSYKKEREMLKVSLERKIEEAEQEASSMKKKYEKEMEHIREESSAIKESLESKLKTKESALCEIQAEIAKKEKDMQHMLNECEKLQSQNIELQERINTYSLEIQSLRQNMEQSLSKEKALENEFHSCVARNEEQRMRHEEIIFAKETEISELKARNEELSLQKQDMEVKGDRKNLEVELLQSRVRELENECEGLRKSHEYLQSKYNELQSHMDSICNKVKECEKVEEEISKTSDAEKISKLETDLKSAENEIETYTEQIEDLERKLNAEHKSKELAEKEYYLCIQEKERYIDELEYKISELQSALKQVECEVSNSKTISEVKVKETETIQSHNSSVGQNGDENSKMYAHELAHLEKKLEEMKTKLEDTEKKLKESMEKEEIWDEKYQRLYYSIRQKILEAEANCQKKLDVKEDKFRELEQKYTDVDIARMNIEMELTSAKKLNADLAKDNELLKRKIRYLEAQDSDALRQEVEMLNMSLQEMTEKVRQSEASVKKNRLENHSLLAQLDFANRQIREMKKDADRKSSLSTSSSKTPRYASRISRAALERFSKKKGLKKPVSPSDNFTSPKKRASSVREEPISKKHRIVDPSPSQSPLTRFFQRCKDKKSKDARPSSSFVRESRGSPFLVQRNTSRYSSVKETYLVQDRESNLASTSHAADFWKCYDEDDFNNLPTLSGFRSLPNESDDDTSSRVSELQRRNTLVPPHMRSSYPVEMQMQPHYNWDSIREGPVKKEDDDDEDLDSSDPEPLPDSENPYELWKQKITAGLSPEEAERKLDEPLPRLKGLNLRCMNPYHPNGKRRNPFQLPYLSASEKRMRRERNERKRREREAKEKEEREARGESTKAK